MQCLCDEASLIYTILGLKCYTILGINVEKYYIHNTFTTNFKWQIAIGCYYEQQSNLSSWFKLEQITTYYL